MLTQRHPQHRAAFLEAFLSGLVELIYPAICLSCRKKLPPDTPHRHVCPQCWNGIKKCVPPFCRRCGRQLDSRAPGKNICPECVRTQLHFDRAFSACRYEGVAKDLIHQFKYGQKHYLGETLGRLMVEHALTYHLPFEVIDGVVPVPLHKAKLREREFNQAEVLGAFVAQEFGKKVIADALVRRRPTRTQAELSGRERFANVRESFEVADPAGVRGKNLLLVDDVLTTGATSSEAALALKKSGAGIVFVLTLAN